MSRVSSSQNKEAGVTGFSMGWIGTYEHRKCVKLGKSKTSKSAGEKGKIVIGPGPQKDIKKGQWTRLTNRPVSDLMEAVQLGVEGPKQKASETLIQEELNTENEKKLKVEEETKKLSVLFATHLGLMKVVEQPR